MRKQCRFARYANNVGCNSLKRGEKGKEREANTNFFDDTMRNTVFLGENVVQGL